MWRRAQKNPDLVIMKRLVTWTSQQWYAMMRPSRMIVEKLMTDLSVRE